MEKFSTLLWYSGLLLLGLLLYRASRAKAFRRFPLFYSYVTYILLGSLSTLLIYHLRPAAYPTAYWFYILVSFLAEFAVLVEISDHIFEPYPAVRRLGQFLTLCVTSAFFAFNVLPALLQPKPSSAALLDFALRISVTKAAILCALLIPVWYLRLALDRNTGGLMLGFALYLGGYITTLSCAQAFGRQLYANVFRLMLPLAYTLCVAVWVVAMWKYEPVRRTGSQPPDRLEPTASLAARLTRFDSSLMRLIRK